MVLILGTNRYYESQAWLLKGKFPASRGSIFLLTAISVSVCLTHNTPLIDLELTETADRSITGNCLNGISRQSRDLGISSYLEIFLVWIVGSFNFRASFGISGLRLT
jgi:hypothetical protein